MENKNSYKSFGDPRQNQEPDPEMQAHEEEGIGNIKQNARNAKISENLMNDFMKGKEDDLNKTTNLNHKNYQPSFEDQQVDSEEIPETEESKIDDDLVEKQAQEAEELLEEAQKTMKEDEQDESMEEEEDEVEKIAKMAQENRVEEVSPEGEEEEDEDNNDHMTKDNKFELNYTVGRIEDGAAILISKNHSLIEIPL